MPWVLMDSKELLGELPEAFNSFKPLCKEIWGIFFFFSFPFLRDGALQCTLVLQSDPPEMLK